MEWVEEAKGEYVSRDDVKVFGDMPCFTMSYDM